MEAFENGLAQATAPEAKGLLGAICLVINHKCILYHHASGRQSLDSDNLGLDPNSTITLASTGKFITHLAAFQLVERGFIALDDPASKYVPEIDDLPLIRPSSSDQGFELLRPATKITLRHLLLHTSGLSDIDVPLVKKYLESDCEKIQHKEDAPFIVKNCSIPLIFEPGEGFAYGESIHWLQLLITRLIGRTTPDFLDHIKTNIFDPLGMKSSEYIPRDVPHIWERRLSMVERESGELIPADEFAQGLMCSILDIAAILHDMISPSPVLLKQTESIILFFNGAFAQGSNTLNMLRENHENYAFCAGMPDKPPRVNWSAGGGLVVEEELPVSGMPKGTVTWDGMPNVLCAMNREKGLAMYFATQLIPVGDQIANGLATMFMRDAWNTFG